MTPGIHPDISNADYHAATGYSKSDLDRVARSPAHFRYGTVEVTPAMILGTAVHTAVLEPERWEQHYRQGEGKAKKSDPIIPGMTVLTSDHYALCLRIRDAVWDHPTCRELLSQGAAELSAWWHDPMTLLPCKCRPDWSRHDCLVDLKTTQDASPRAFGYSVDRYRYHVQAAYYLDGWNQAGGNPVDTFIFMAVEKAPPFAIGFYELSLPALQLGQRLYRSDLVTIEECLIQDQWPGYSPHVTVLELPRWSNYG